MNDTPFSVRSEAIQVPMRDGTRLSVHVRRPDAAEPVPAILSYTPYGKGPLNPGSHHPIVEHGYATVTFDIRGTGNSEGWNDSIYSDVERQDGYDMVEWTASQPWCTGNVGMWGISFGAVVALQMAKAAPPHLKAVIARSGTDDPYTEWTNPGGSPRPYMYLCYAPIMTASNFSPPDPAEVGGRWAEIWQERLERNVPWGISFLQNLLDGPFWRARSLRGHYDQVRCPVFVVGGWADWYPTPLLRTFSQLTVPRRALIGPWSHQWPDAGIPGPRIDWLQESLKWFDRWLKGVENGVTEEPPVTLFVREYNRPATLVTEDRGAFRCQAGWPPPSVQPTPLYLLAHGRLGEQPPAEDGEGSCDRLEYNPCVGASTGMHGGGPFNINWAMPLDQRADEPHSLVYSTEPLPEPVEVIGRPCLRLHFASTARITFFAVKLCDVAPDGTSALVSKGYLNVAHRESHHDPSPLEPGRVYQVEVDLLACAYRFARGHRLRVTIASADFLNAWPTPEPCTNTVYRCSERPSHLLLPIASPVAPPLPEPNLTLLPLPANVRDTLDAPELLLTRDVIRDLTTLHYVATYGPYWRNEARFTVSSRDPAQAVAHATAWRSHHFPGRDITVEAECVTTSDAAAFHHTVVVEITVNDRRYFSKSWSTSVPRPWA